jgi:hypothetical protein
VARVCTICRHDKRNEIEESIFKLTTVREIAKQFKVAESTVQRHKDCIIVETRQVKEKQAAIRANLRETQVHNLTKVTQEILDDAKGRKNFYLALQCIARLEKQIDILARLNGEYQNNRNNETDEAKLRRQFDAAVEQMVEDCKADGVVITQQMAELKIIELNPQFARFLGAD